MVACWGHRTVVHIHHNTYIVRQYDGPNKPLFHILKPPDVSPCVAMGAGSKCCYDDLAAYLLSMCV